MQTSYIGESRVSFYYPDGMTSDGLYPESSSTYTTADGTEHDVICFVPKEPSDAIKEECPYPFVNPVDKDHLKSCVQACPIVAFTDDEYSLMWTVYVLVGSIGFLANLFVVATWYLGGQKGFHALPFQLKFCVFAGIVFFLLGTLPSMALKYDLPCSECNTEECTGTSVVCAINRSSAYILLSILVNLR